MYAFGYAVAKIELKKKLESKYPSLKLESILGAKLILLDNAQLYAKSNFMSLESIL